MASNNAWISSLESMSDENLESTSKSLAHLSLWGIFRNRYPEMSGLKKTVDLEIESRKPIGGCEHLDYEVVVISRCSGTVIKTCLACGATSPVGSGRWLGRDW